MGGNARMLTRQDLDVHTDATVADGSNRLLDMSQEDLCACCVVWAIAGDNCLCTAVKHTRIWKKCGDKIHSIAFKGRRSW